MSIAERVELARPPEHKSLSLQLRVAFQRFVGNQTGQESLISSPGFTLETGEVNLKWLDEFRGFNLRVSRPWRQGARPGPGTLRLNPDTKTLEPADGQSPVGQIATLKDKARAALTDHISPADSKRLEREARRALVDIFNGYAGIRFNSVRDVVNGKDFRGINFAYLASRDLRAWYQDLLRTRQQSVNPTLFDRWDGADRNIATPTRADQFFHTLFEELSKTPEDQLSFQAGIFSNLLSLSGSIAYREIADTFYGGDMQKTYVNLSAVAKMSGLSLPHGWQAFHGSTAEFKSLQQRLHAFVEGIEGYLNAADLYGGDMQKTYMNLSAVAKMSGLSLPHGWQAFLGSTAEFTTQKNWLLQNPSATIDEFMTSFEIKSRNKARMNLAALKKMIFPAEPVA